MSVYEGNRYDGWNEYITYGGIPLVVLANTEEQKMAILDNLLKETYINDIVKRKRGINSLFDTFMTVCAGRSFAGILKMPIGYISGGSP